MNGNAQKLIKYLDGASKRFIIPVYQRNYDWKMEHCKQLYDDLVKIIRQNRKSHFFGSIVSVQSESGTMEEFLIIDGQQRLTTISLLLLAIYHLLSSGKMVSRDHQLTDKILKKYLIDEYEPEEKRIKLKPIKNDQKAFGILFDQDEEYIPDSNLTINYRYFYDRIQHGELDIDELFDAICKLEIINISLNHEDNPQLIFESLNSTGLNLSEGDKIRNYILMGLPNDQQTKFYEKYWNRIESYTDYDVSSFVRDYLTLYKSICGFCGHKCRISSDNISATQNFQRTFHRRKACTLLLNEGIYSAAPAAAAAAGLLRQPAGSRGGGNAAQGRLPQTFR